MSDCACRFRWSCAAIAVVASVILGVIAAFLQISAVIAIGTVFLWVVLGAALAYLGVLVLATALSRRRERSCCLCDAVNGVLAGILGTILFAAVLLTVDVAAASVIGAILVGLLVLFATLTVTSTACLVRCLTDCEN